MANKSKTWMDLLKDCRTIKQGRSETFSDERLYGKQDFDNIIFMSSFRRLQGKAQVFPLENSDHTRTRLTHSLEVMSICESLGEKLITMIKYHEKIDPADEEVLNNVTYVLRAAALIHDLGNPPFGHLGEKLISEWFNEKGNNLPFSTDVGRGSSQTIGTILGDLGDDFARFDGNAQTLRILLSLQDIDIDVDQTGEKKATSSIDWSHQLLATLIKYPYNKDGTVYGGKNKKCVFNSEKEYYNKIQKEFDLNGKRFPLTYLLEAADDIAYLSSDLEDAIKKGHIKYVDFIDSIKKAYKECDKCSQSAKDLNYFLSYFNRKKGDKMNRIKKLIMFIKGRFIRSVKQVIDDKFNDITNSNIEESLLQNSSMNVVEGIIRKMLQEKVYYCDEIVRKKIMARKVIYLLLDRFIPAVVNGFDKENTDSSSSLHSLLMSNNYSEICKFNISKVKDDTRKAKNILYFKICLVIDMISGMTDRYAYEIYELLS